MTTVLLIFGIIYLLAMCAFLIFGIVSDTKSNNTFKNHKIIIEAIHDYHMDMLEQNRSDSIMVDYSDMRSYEESISRWRDWGYEHILPPDKFEIIKKYIKKEQNK